MRGVGVMPFQTVQLNVDVGSFIQKQVQLQSKLQSMLLTNFVVVDLVDGGAVVYAPQALSL